MAPLSAASTRTRMPPADFNLQHLLDSLTGRLPTSERTHKSPLWPVQIQGVTRRKETMGVLSQEVWTTPSSKVTRRCSQHPQGRLTDLPRVCLWPECHRPCPAMVVRATGSPGSRGGRDVSGKGQEQKERERTLAASRPGRCSIPSSSRSGSSSPRLASRDSTSPFQAAVVLGP